MCSSDLTRSLDPLWRGDELCLESLDEPEQVGVRRPLRVETSRVSMHQHIRKCNLGIEEAGIRETHNIMK